MCGIAGIVGNRDPEALKRMLEAIRHRGPDDQGMYMANELAIGMNRLSVIDLSQAAHQPMSTADGRFTIVYNGEIFNFRQLREELEQLGVAFHSQSDTEVLLWAYVKFGKDCLLKIRGMFSFAVWDDQNKKLFAARDHLGIKPFLYSLKNEKLVFCSEIKGLIQSSYVSKQLDSESLGQYLMFGYIIPPDTIFSDIKSLLPGHFLEYQNGKLSIARYWDLVEQKSEIELDDSNVLLWIREFIYRAVEEQLISDVPLGVFLSGGMDSAIILSAMRELGIRDIETFSMGFADSAGLDESADAEKSAAFYRTNHHKLIVSGGDVAGRLESFVYGLDQPSLDGLNTYLISEEAKRHVTVTLSGLGGDELFIGYNWQFRPTDSTRLSNLLWHNISLVKTLIPRRYHNLIDINSSFSDPIKYYQKINRLFSNEETCQLLNGHVNVEGPLEKPFKTYLPPSSDLLRKITYFDLKLFMASRLLRDNDAVAMKHSLEVRFPLIDHRLCEFAWNLPSRLKLAGVQKAAGYGGRKKLLFEAFREKLPPDLPARLKRGFKMPYENWLRNELKPFVHEAASQDVLSQVLNPANLDSLFKQWFSSGGNWTLIWQLVTLHIWLKRFLR